MLLSTIQTALGGVRGFLISSFLPVLLFATGSFAVALQLRPEARAWVSRLEAAQMPYPVFAALLGLLVGAYVFSTLSTFLRETLEGKGLFESWIFGRRPLCRLLESWRRAQARKLSDLETRFWGCQREQRRIHGLQWVLALRQARQAGRATGANPAAGAGPRTQVSELLRLRGQGDFIEPRLIEEAINPLIPVLTAHSSDLATDESRALKVLHEDLLRCIDYAEDRCQYEINRLYNERQFRYPGTLHFLADEEVSPFNILAPTTMGNIARTVHSYAITRYGINLDIFWIRLQRTAQKDEKFFGGLQEAKTQLDFLISLCWLTGAFALLWGVLLPFVSQSVPLFLAVAAGGPVLTRICYRLACQSYSAFADQLRSTVDFFRFGLLEDLRIAPPYGTEEEKRLWEALNSWTGYNSTKGMTYHLKS